MTLCDSPQPRHFQPLEQSAFRRLEHAAYLKGLLQPFKGKGSLELWANQCMALRDAMMGLAQQHILPQARAHPRQYHQRLAGTRLSAKTRPRGAGIRGGVYAD